MSGTNKTEKLRESLSALMDNETDELEIRRLLAALDDGDAELAQELRATWSRYQAASFAMKNDLPDRFLDIDISASVRAALDDESGSDIVQDVPASEDLGSKESHQGDATWMRPLSGLGIAATAAFVTFFGVTQYQSLNEPAIEVAATASSSVAQLSATTAPSQQLNAPVNAVASRLSPTSTQSSQSARPFTQLPASSNSLAVPVSYGSQKLGLAPDLQRAQINRAQAEKQLDAYLLHHAEHAALNGSYSMLPLARVANFEKP